VTERIWFEQEQSKQQKSPWTIPTRCNFDWKRWRVLT